jgi:hypothetical protein
MIEEEEDDIPLKRILVPLDGSDFSFRAVKYAIKVAKMANAEIFFMHAVVNPPYGDPRSGGMMISAYIVVHKCWEYGFRTECQVHC